MYHYLLGLLVYFGVREKIAPNNKNLQISTNYKINTIDLLIKRSFYSIFHLIEMMKLIYIQNTACRQPHLHIFIFQSMPNDKTTQLHTSNPT